MSAVTPVVYLHGFASGPGSKKARRFGEFFAARDIPFTVPDLAAGDFAHLTLSGQLRVVQEAIGDQRVHLIGSSLGGYLAALFAAANPGRLDRLVLMAPAFDFAARWRARLGEETFDDWQRTGALPVFHYGAGGNASVGFGLYTEALQYPPFPCVTQPTSIFHGLRDEVVPASLSQRFVECNPHARLRLLDSDHELLDVTDTIQEETWRFFQG